MRMWASVAAVFTWLLLVVPIRAEQIPLSFTVRDRVETSDGSGRYHVRQQAEKWDPTKTAVILCDVWDSHHCRRAVLRVEEMGPRLAMVVNVLRKQGVTVIHAPSDCMAHYENSAARKRALDVPKSKSLPPEITTWCRQIPSEEKAVYPVDQSDGGEDDEPEEHAAWQKELAAEGRNPRLPWKKQSDLIPVDEQTDFVSDKGDEIWSILESRGINNVILAGVHTNMCVLGRPFGLRQMARNGKHVVLMRDMTDTMYNPARWPYVSHFTGTDRVIEHIEKYVCPTVTSDQVLGGATFQFKNDQRPHVVLLMAEDEYKTETTLPRFAADFLGRDFRVTSVFGSDQDRNEIPGLEAIEQADLLVVSARRRVLRPAAMALLRKSVDSGKPIIGLRTASHAWSLRNTPAPDGFVAWTDWDATVFGGNYTNHHPAGKPTTIQPASPASGNPLLIGVGLEAFTSPASLYKVSPLKPGTTPLLMGHLEGAEPEPVAWTFLRADGGKSFYTSLGNVDDFQNPAFQRLLFNAVHALAGRDIPESLPPNGPEPKKKI